MNPNTPNSPVQNTPSINTAPLPKPNSASQFLYWLKTHKKRTLVILAAIILSIFVILTIFLTVKNRFFPNIKLPSSITPREETAQLTLMQLKTPKTTFNLTENIPVSVFATSDNLPIVGFDTLIEYDSQFLTFSKRNTKPLSNFDYFGKNTDKLVQISGVIKPDNNPPPFANTELFSLEFTPKKKGKTAINVIYLPNATSESNLIDANSKDVLGNVRGVEITIN